MSSLRTLAAYELKDAISALDATWEVCVLQTGLSKEYTPPCVNISPSGKFIFRYFNEEEVYVDPDSDQQILELGVLEGKYRLWISAASTAKREEMEDQIINLFMQNELQPGVLITTVDDVYVAAVATAYSAVVCFDLMESEWMEDMVDADDRIAELTLDVNIPVLVARNTPNIDSLVAYFTNDLDEDDTDVLETISDKFDISEDGELSPYVPPGD